MKHEITIDDITGKVIQHLASQIGVKTMNVFVNTSTEEVGYFVWDAKENISHPFKLSEKQEAVDKYNSL